MILFYAYGYIYTEGSNMRQQQGVNIRHIFFFLRLSLAILNLQNFKRHKRRVNGNRWQDVFGDDQRTQ